MDHDDYGPGNPIPTESYSSSLILERTPRNWIYQHFFSFSGRPMCPGRALLFFGSPHLHTPTSDESSSVLGRQKFLPHWVLPITSSPLVWTQMKLKQFFFSERGQVNLQSRTGQVQGWDFCASVDDPSTHLHLLGLGGWEGGVKPCLCPLLQRDELPLVSSPG